jgi:hypothetical protein
MAKAFAPPKGYNFNFDWNKDWQQQEDAYVERLRKFCKKHTDSKSNLVGVVFRFPCADSHACYMVFRTKPLELIHVPIGDAWEASDYEIRGLRISDIKAQVEWDNYIKGLHKEKA